jgi:hypothetical protein
MIKCEVIAIEMYSSTKNKLPAPRLPSGGESQDLRSSQLAESQNLARGNHAHCRLNELVFV